MQDKSWQHTPEVDPSIIQRRVEVVARAHFTRLKDDQRSTSDAMIKEYLDRKMWIERDVAECRRSAHLPTPIFLIGGGARKARIVCDFRSVNKHLPIAGNDGLSPAHLLCALRLTNAQVICVADAEKAFYKIRLHDPGSSGTDRIWLVGCSIDSNGKIATRHFLTDRMAFGLSFGPSGLVSTMRGLFGCAQFRSFNGWYIDDLTLAGTPSDVQYDLELVTTLLNRCGHSLQESKTSYISSSPAVQPTSTAKAFNAELQFTPTGLRISCDTRNREDALLRLSRIIPSQTRMSKADFFQIAGAISYDLVRAHPQERILGDALRSLIGREFSALGWHTPIALAKMSSRKTDALCIIIHWAKELLANTKCAHITVHKKIFDHRIDIFVDASETGAGFFIQCNQNTVWEDAWMWSRSERNWHSNRKECHVLLIAHQVLTDILTCLGQQDRKWVVTFFGDNRSALRWTACSPLDVSRKQERRAIGRLIDSIREESRYLRKYATINICHLPGSENVHADQLSRIGDRRLCEDGETLAQLLGPEPQEYDRRNLISLLQGVQEVDDEPCSDQDRILDAGDPNSLMNSQFDPDGSWRGHISSRQSTCPRTLDMSDASQDSLFSLPNPTQGATSMQILDRIYYLEMISSARGLGSEVMASPPIPAFTQEVGVPEGDQRCCDGVSNLRLEPVSDCANLATTTTPGRSDLTPPWVETCSSDAYDIGSVCRMAAVMRYVIRFWRMKGRTPNEIQDTRVQAKSDFDESYPELWSEEDRINVARSAQTRLGQLPKNLQSEVGPLFKDLRTGVWFYKRPLPSAEYVYDLFIPSHCARLQEKIIMSAHRRVGHMGLDYTMSQIGPWWLHRGMKRGAEVLKFCLHCQMKHAGKHRGFKADLQLSFSSNTPFSAVALDHLSIGDKVTCLTSICLTTGFSIWVYCRSHTTEDTLQAFTALCQRFPRSPEMLFTDNASCFSSMAAEFQARWGVPIRHERAPSYSQFQNGKLERLHSVGLSILSTHLHLDQLSVSGDPLEVQFLLDAVCHSLNLRPIGQVYSCDSGNRFAITPSLLVYGTSVHNPCMDEEDTPVISHGPRLPQLVDWIKIYQRHYWGRLKEQSYRTMASRSRKSDFCINETILYYQKGSKLRLDFRMGIVRDIRGNECTVSTRGKLLKVNLYNCVKLKLRASQERHAFDVTRRDARVRYVLNNVVYIGTVVREEPDSSLLIRWDIRDGIGWPDEFLYPQEVEFLEDYPAQTPAHQHD